MTQTKPVKKKKKTTKGEKGKKNEKKTEIPKPVTEEDKRAEAEKNVREMILEAHKIHRDHLISKFSRGKYKPVLAGISEICRETEGPYTGRDGGRETPEKGIRRAKMTKSLSASQPETVTITRGRIRSGESPRTTTQQSAEKGPLAPSLYRRRNYEPSSSNGSSRRGSAEPCARRSAPVQRRTSEECPPKKKETVRRGSAEYPARKTEAVPHRWKSAEYPARKKEEAAPKRAAAEPPPRKRRETVRRETSEVSQAKSVRPLQAKKARSKKTDEGAITSIKGYQIGTVPFVSLELLDKTKCQSSSTCLRESKHILRKRSKAGSIHDTGNTTASSVDTLRHRGKISGAATRKSTKEKDGPKSKAATAAGAKDPSKKGSKKNHLESSKNIDSEPSPDSRESAGLNVAPSAYGFNSAGGDLFSPNTSHSYISSESDVSKIDQKFMQILEAVTQSNLMISAKELSTKEARSTEEAVSAQDRAGTTVSEGRGKPEAPSSVASGTTQRDGKEEFEAVPRMPPNPTSTGSSKKSLKVAGSTQFKSEGAKPTVTTNLSEERSKRSVHSEEKLKKFDRSKGDGPRLALDNSEPTTVQEIWVKDNSSREEHSSVSMAIKTSRKAQKDDAIGETGKEYSSEPDGRTKSDEPRKADNDGRTAPDAGNRQLQDSTKKVIRRGREPDPRTIISMLRVSEAEMERKRVASANSLTADKRQILRDMLKKDACRSSRGLVSKAFTPESSTETAGESRGEGTGSHINNRNKCREIKTWSIIKRLEKAFQTLGLDLKDMETSEDESSSLEKKKISAKRKSSGKEKRHPTKTEANRRTNSDRASVGGKPSKADYSRSTNRRTAEPRARSKDDAQDDKYGCESNGSGDKNLDNRMLKKSKKTVENRLAKDRIKDRAYENSAAYYAVVAQSKRIVPNKKSKNAEALDVDGLSQGDLPVHRPVSKKKNSRESSDHSASKERLKGKKSRMTLLAEDIAKAVQVQSRAEDKDKDRVSPKGSDAKQNKSHSDDLNVEVSGRRSSKRKSDYSLSASCSYSSLSEDDDFKRHKRKKKNLTVRRRSCKEPWPRTGSEEGLWKTNQSGKGDAANEVCEPVPQMAEAQHAKCKETPRKSGAEQAAPKTPKKAKVELSRLVLGAFDNTNYELVKMEEEKNELELKQLRQRHKEIISEIKTSLDEIRKQHNLYSKLQKQTKRFNRDCHMKRKLIASYLRDVEANYEWRKARGYQSRSETKGHYLECDRECRVKAATADRYKSHRRRTAATDRLSDCDLQLIRLRKKLRRGAIGCGKVRRNDSFHSIMVTSNELSSGTELENIRRALHTSTEFLSSDTEDERESFRSVTSSPEVRGECQESKEEKMVVVRTKSEVQVDKRSMVESMEMLCLEWRKLREDTSNGETQEAKVKEVPSYLSQLLEKLNKIIVKEKNQLHNLVVRASGSSNSAYSDRTRLTSSSNSSGNDLPKHQYNQLDERAGSERRATSLSYKSSSTSVGNGNPRQHKSKCQCGKMGNHDNLTEVDCSIPVTRSRTLIQGDPGGGSRGSTTDVQDEIVQRESHPTQDHILSQVEEFRYRKGDPSFSFQRYMLECVAEHSRSHRKKSAEDEGALKRKAELERILHTDEPPRGRFAESLSRGHDGHYDRARHVRHRQQSLIIDHNKGEDNEESQTVLGHASRHIASNRKLDRKRIAHEYYLAAERELEARLRASWKMHDHGRKRGRSSHTADYFEKSADLESPGIRSKDVFCQTDRLDDSEDVTDIYQFDDA